MAALERQVDAVRRAQRAQETTEQFWRLWDLRWGVRKELLFIGLGVALPAFIFGSSKPFLSIEYVWALAGAIFGFLAMLGLLPAHLLRRELTMRPSWVQQFMSRHKRFEDGADFSRKIYRFLRTQFRKKGDKAGLDLLLGMERVYAWVLVHGWWAIPLTMIVCLAFAAAILALIAKSFG